jgi:hypothetical protein
MMFPRLVADLQQSGIAVRLLLILKGRAHTTLAFALEDCKPEIAQIACDKTAG